MVGVSSIQKRGKMVYSNAKLIIRIYTKRKKNVDLLRVCMKLQNIFLKLMHWFSNCFCLGQNNVFGCFLPWSGCYFCCYH